MGGRDRADAASKDSVYIGRVDAKGAVKWAASKTTLREPRAAFGCAVTP
jgi:hypothetical protein